MLTPMPHAKHSWLLQGYKAALAHMCIACRPAQPPAQESKAQPAPDSGADDGPSLGLIKRRHLAHGLNLAKLENAHPHHQPKGCVVLCQQLVSEALCARARMHVCACVCGRA